MGKPQQCCKQSKDEPLQTSWGGLVHGARWIEASITHWVVVKAREPRRAVLGGKRDCPEGKDGKKWQTETERTWMS